MYLYYHWNTYFAFDGEKVQISNIILVESNVKIKPLNDDPYIKVKIRSNGVDRLVSRHTLYNTEKEAICSIIKYLKECIHMLYDNINTGVLAPPKNPHVWIYKAKDCFNMYFEKYNLIYPELFI